MSRCWFMQPHEPVVHCLLGRHGDLIQMCPAWREIHRRTGTKPIVIVSSEYASTLEGVSYVQADPINGHWWQGMPKARVYAEAKYGGSTLVQWWLEKTPVPPEFRGPTVLQCFAHNWGINLERWPTYGHSMWERAGFPDERDMLTLPLVFDQRSGPRELSLVNLFYAPLNRKKPLLLFNFSGVSSPFGFLPELWPVIQKFAHRFTLLDLGKIKAQRVFDLLGLYDMAAGLLTIDTATLHLAPASKVPYIAFTVDAWTRSVPKGNCVLNIPYNSTPRRLHEIAAVLERWP